jgi:hypothetical protein
VTDLWSACQGEKYTKSLKMGIWRCVEDQGRSYTRKLVSSEEEHDILEELLEKKSKPFIKDSIKNLHYLLYTPFRYPPLKYGSRFGSQQEPSLFYASLEAETALAEKAFYSLCFLRSSDAELRSFTKELTSFKANMDTPYGIDLTQKPFSKYTDQISSPAGYSVSQKLGSIMRENNIKAFIFHSSRQDLGKNMGIFSPTVLKENEQLEKSFVHWNCFISKEKVEFSLKFSKNPTVVSFTAEQFFVNSRFPNISKT